MIPVEQDPARELVAQDWIESAVRRYFDMKDEAECATAFRLIGELIGGAEAALAALAEAGRLLPAGGEERTEWAVHEGGEISLPCKGSCAFEHTHRRTVTEWPDGRMHTTGWVEAGTDGP